mgnify:CR=1 FL=1
MILIASGAYIASEFQIELGKEVLSIDPAYFRPTEVDLLIGDPTKALNAFGVP